jgi:hypothetical protein
MCDYCQSRRIELGYEKCVENLDRYYKLNDSQAGIWRERNYGDPGSATLEDITDMPPSFTRRVSTTAGGIKAPPSS